MIPFDLRITEETDDRFLREKLKDEFPGILIWAAKGYRKWLDFGLQPPQKVKDTTCNYKDEEDDLGQFMMDYCIPDPKHSIPTHEFKKKFKEIMGYAKSQKVISEYMERNGIPTCRQYVDGAQVKCWEGLKFPSIFEQKEDRHDYKDKEIFF